MKKSEKNINVNYEEKEGLLFINKINTGVLVSGLFALTPEEKKEKIAEKTHIILTDYEVSALNDFLEKIKPEFLEKCAIATEKYNANENHEKLQKLHDFFVEKKRIAVGIHNNVMYFGFTNLTKNSRHKNFIITSKRRLYVDDEITNEFGLDEFVERSMAVKHDLSVAGIQNIIDGKEVKLSDVFDRIINIQKSAVWNPKQGYHETIACDIISTYFTPCWFSRSRTYIHGERGSGKTQQLNVYGALACRPILTSDTTQASIFRLAHTEQPTILIDDYDDYDKNKSQAINHIIKAYKKNQTATRVNDNFKIEVFDVFAPVVFNNISGIDVVLLDRCVKHTLIKCPDNFKPINVEKLAESEQIQELRDDLFLLALNMFDTIKKTYDELEDLLALTERSKEKTLHILTIAKLVNEETYKKVQNYLEIANDQATADDEEEEKEAILLTYLAKRTKTEEKIRVTAKGIAETLASDIIPYYNPDNAYYQKEFHNLTIWIGKKLRRYGFFVYKPSGAATFIITKNEVMHILKTKKNILEPNLLYYTD